MKFDPGFSVEVTRDDTAIRIALFGELDISTVGELKAALPSPEPGEVLIVDLRELEFMDSSGIGILFRLDVAARADGWTLIVVRGSPAVQRMLDLCNLGERVRLVDEPAEISPTG
jgi:anti-anti-sigma factor